MPAILALAAPQNNKQELTTTKFLLTNQRVTVICGGTDL